MDVAIIAAVALGALLVVVLVAWWRSVRTLRRRIQVMDSAKRSQSTRYGQITEQFAPFMPDWPWDPKQFRFLGTPVDGVQFTPEGVVFVEIKSAGSRLSAVQRQVRDQVRAGRVYWHEVRVG